MSKESTLTAEVEDKKAQRNIGDPVIWGIYISLVLISMVESFSASSQIIGTGAGMYAPIFKHAILLFGGFCALLVFYFTNYKNFPSSSHSSLLLPSWLLSSRPSSGRISMVPSVPSTWDSSRYNRPKWLKYLLWLSLHGLRHHTNDAKMYPIEEFSYAPH